jgi:hypothetical protein
MRHRVRREAREGLFRKQILHSSDLGIGVGIVVAVGIEINVDPDHFEGGHMKCMRSEIIVLSALLGVAAPAFAQPMAKAQVANLIVKVENGVDEFRDYLKRRGETAKDNTSAAQAQGKTTRRKPTEAQKANATAKKDDLDDALGDLNRSTNRLRRKFDATDQWMETKSEVQRVVDDGRRINEVVARGNYGAEAARLWAVLRGGINDLARAYGIAPLAI